MCKLYLIRHGKTYGNSLSRYIGCRTDEPLCEEGREAALACDYPVPQVLYVSPMKRCRETAQILFPQIAEHIIVEELKECDFGDFENKNYKELSGNEEYQKWIDSQGVMAFPGGESMEEFQKRASRSFAGCIEEILKKGYDSAGFVVHGGTIMAILGSYANPKGEYFSWHTDNVQGYEIELDETLWKEKNEFRTVVRLKQNTETDR